MHRKDFHSSRAGRLSRRRDRVRALQLDFRTCSSGSAGCALGCCRGSSLLEFPFELRDLFFSQKAPLPGLEFGVFEKTDADAAQLLDRMADRLKHAADLLISALVESHLKPRIVCTLEPLDFTGGEPLIVNEC